MRTFDTLDQLKSSIETAPKQAYLAPDATGGVRIWEARLKTPIDEEVTGLIEFSAARSDLVLVNRSGFFTNRLRSHQKLQGSWLIGCFYYDLCGQEMYVYIPYVWKNIAVDYS